jgi:hypothetical protein
MELSKRKIGARQWSDWADALGKMGRGAGLVWKERRDEKNKIIKNIYRLTIGNLTKRAKGIYKKDSNVHNLLFK